MSHSSTFLASEIVLSSLFVIKFQIFIKRKNKVDGIITTRLSKNETKQFCKMEKRDEMEQCKKEDGGT